MKDRQSIKRREFLQRTAVAIGASQLPASGIGGVAANLRDEANPGEGRQTFSLNGEWDIEDSVLADQIPQVFHHTAPVPGLAHLAKPSFPDVDKFLSREHLSDLIRFGDVPDSTWNQLGEDGVGISGQKRNYFWYRKMFRVQNRKEVAILKINKAQFGTAVWLNGRKVGEHLGCFSAGYFDLTEALDWKGENTLLVRVGAHPGVLPQGVPAGTDFEKTQWTPGIYDAVSLLLSDNPVITTLQIAPHIGTSEIEVEVVVKNYSTSIRQFDLTHTVKTWREQQTVAIGSLRHLELHPNEEKTWTQRIKIPGATLWTPENPFLYILETRTRGDIFVARFGMREFRFDTPTQRALLNGQVYFLRGSNITLHRFFEDPVSGSLPWNEPWLRKLLIDLPKQMHWNSFRFSVGPVPDQWLDIADEAGLLIQNEYFVWTGPSRGGLYKGRRYDVEETIRQYREWMRDNWNHPSVAIWNANNESLDDIFGDKIIPAVRSLDLSHRPWQNSYNEPAGPDDPVDDHPYLFSRTAHNPAKPFQMTELEGMCGLIDVGSRPAHGHAMINNEYGWLDLHRDGSPTRITKRVYESFLGPDSTAEQRFALGAYLLAGLTEFWRAHRHYAGVLHFVYLTCSIAGAVTSDPFHDVVALELEPHFKDYLGEAFKPLGIYLNFWQPTLPAGFPRRFVVMMVNDHYTAAAGKLVLSLADASGAEAARRELSFQLPGLGQQTYHFDLDLPGKPGNYLLKAAAYQAGDTHNGPTVCRRKVSLTAA
jgi:hypothetical protein